MTNPTDKPKPRKRPVPASASSASPQRPVAATVKAAPRTALTSAPRTTIGIAARRPAPRASGASAQQRNARTAKYAVGQVVRHRIYPFRGVVFDIDPVFSNTEEWWLSIPPEVRPRKDQPFYHLLAENAETEYIAYVSEQNLLPDRTGVKPRHPQVKELFRENPDGQLKPVFIQAH